MIHCEQILTPKGWLRDQAIKIREGKIAAIRPSLESDQYSHNCERVIPGFIDVQVNGGGGILLNSTPSIEAIKTMASAHRQFGTTAMMPTLITDSIDVMIQAAKSIAEAKAAGVPGILGVHFEGPWLSKAKKGIHSETYIRSPSEEEIELISRPELGKVMVTLAPESVELETISKLVDAGVIVFLGHSNATAEQVNAAINAGAIGFTHLYNAMSQLTSREPGMVGVALADKSCYAGLIVDGFHVAPQSCKVAFNAKGKDKLLLVTDAMSMAGSSVSQLKFFDTEIKRVGNKLTTPDGTLAGSCLTMIDAVINTMKMCDVCFEDAVEMASLTPAKMLGADLQLGKLEVGYEASFMNLDSQYSITHLWQQGKEIEVC